MPRLNQLLNRAQLTRGRNPHPARHRPKAMSQAAARSKTIDSLPYHDGPPPCSAPARRHRLHPRTRPCRAHHVGGADLLPGPACARAASPGRTGAGATACAGWAASSRTLSRLLTGIEIHPGAKIGRRVFIDHGMGIVDRRDGGDRRRLHDLPGRHARRHLADQGRQAPSDARAAAWSSAPARKVLGGFTVGDGARVGSNAVVLKPVPPGATAVGIPARIIQAEADASAARQTAAKMGFSAYGLTQSDDPVSQAMKGLIDNASSTSTRSRCSGRRSRSCRRARASCRARTACPAKRTPTETLRRREADPAGRSEVAPRRLRSGRGGLRAESPISAGTPCTPHRRSRGRARRSGRCSTARRRRCPGTSGVAARQALQRLGDRLRLARQVDDQRLGRGSPRTWRDRIAVGTKRRLICRICSPKPGISLSATASVASGVTSRGAGPVPPVVSTRSQPAPSTSSLSVAAIAPARRGSAGLPVDRVAQRARQPVLQRRQALVLVDAAGGAVADRDDADAHGVVVGRRASAFRHSAGFGLADELEQLAVGAPAALLRRPLAASLRALRTSARRCCVSAPAWALAKRVVGLVVGDQLVAPALGLVQGQRVAGRAELALDDARRAAVRRRRVRMSLPMYLHLAAPAFVAR